MNTQLFSHSRRVLLLTLAASLAMAACTKEIEFEGEITDPLVVLTSHSEADSILSVRLTYSRFFLRTDSIRSINNATFTTELNGSLTNTAFQSTGWGVYRSNLTLRCGDTLTLHANVPGYGEVSAGCRIPQRPVVSDIHREIIPPDTSGDDGYYYYWYETSISFRLHDPVGENYYMLRTIWKDSITGEQREYYFTVDDDLLFPESSTEDLFGDLTSNGNDGREYLFTDEMIEGQTHTIKISIDHDTNELKDLTLEVCSISRDTYLYHTTLQAQQNTGGIGTFSEPVRIHCNVTGGIGLLDAIAVTPIPYSSSSTPSPAPRKR